MVNSPSKFVEGHLSINWQAFVEDNIQDERDPQTHAWNIGEKLGLTGLVSSITGGIWLFPGL